MYQVDFLPQQMKVSPVSRLFYLKDTSYFPLHQTMQFHDTKQLHMIIGYRLSLYPRRTSTLLRMFID